MKKFWIIFSIIITVLIGINSFLFIPNSFAMTTVISQNKEKIMNLTENAVKNLNKQNYLDMTIKEVYKESEFYSATMSSSIKFIKDDLDYIFTASVLRVVVKSEDEGETFTTEKIEYNVYYNKGDYYWHFLENEQFPELKGKKIKSEGVHIETATQNAFGIYYSTLFQEFDRSIFDEELFDVSSSILLTFKPFVFGQKFKYSTENEFSTKTSYEYDVCMFGGLKKYTYKRIGEAITNITEITYNNFNKFTIPAPEDLDEYVLDLSI